MLMRFDPFRELDRFADEALGAARSRTATMPLDAYRQGDRFIVAIDLPGVNPDSVDITIEKNVLTVRAERSWGRAQGQEWVVAERHEGTFSRQLFLGDSLDTEAIAARFEHGVLTLEIPVAERAKPRRVAVSVGDQAQSVDTKSIDTSSASVADGEKQPAGVG